MRVYAPSATLTDSNDLMVFFAGYHTPKPKNGPAGFQPVPFFDLALFKIHCGVCATEASSTEISRVVRRARRWSGWLAAPVHRT